MSDAQFEQYVEQEMPGIAEFDAQAPGVVELVGPVIGKMQAVPRRTDTKASDIPVSWLPLTSAPWLFVRSNHASQCRGSVHRETIRAHGANLAGLDTPHGAVTAPTRVASSAG